MQIQPAREKSKMRTEMNDARWGKWSVIMVSRDRVELKWVVEVGFCWRWNGLLLVAVGCCYSSCYCCCCFTMGPFSDSIVVSLAVNVTIKRERVMQIASGLSMIKERPSVSKWYWWHLGLVKLVLFMIVTCQRIASQFELRDMLLAWGRNDILACDKINIWRRRYGW